jgi:hypothetical protein
MDVPFGAGAPAHDSRRQRSFYCAKAYLLIPFVNPKGPRRNSQALAHLWMWRAAGRSQGLNIGGVYA